MSIRLTQDQNLTLHFNGVNTNGLPKNKGGLGGRKPLNDISNSAKPSTKRNTKNLMIPVADDLGVLKKPQVPVSGRKPLGDLTNSAVPSSNKPRTLNKKNQGKLPHSIAEEGFLHNHDECIKSQKRKMDFDEFLKTIGLDEGTCFKSVSACNSPPRTSKDVIFEIEELPEPLIEDGPRGGLTSPSCGSPKLSYMMGVKDFDDFPSFVLIESPFKDQRRTAESSCLPTAD